MMFMSPWPKTIFVVKYSWFVKVWKPQNTRMWSNVMVANCVARSGTVALYAVLVALSLLSFPLF